jgi:NCS1 family nucleobase:cation symporter-1
MHDPALTREALAELPADIATSPLFNGDLAPVPARRRTWTTWNFAALWISMAHCLPTYMLAGGLIALGMNWWQALLTIALGNVIVLVPILLNAHPGTRYGIPFPVLARSSFGTVGANVPAILRAVVACGWFGIQTYIGGEAVRTFLAAAWPAFNEIGAGATVMGLGLPTTMFGFSAMAVVITSAAEGLLKGTDPKTLWDPVVVLGHITSSVPPAGFEAPLLADAGTRWAVALLALLGVAVATIATNIAANVVSPANDFANCAPRLISFRTGGVITGVVGILIMPWRLLANPEAYIFNWLVGYGALLGPIAGIMVVDYWLVRRTQLDVPDLYRPKGRYAGTNPVALVALVAGVAPNIIGFAIAAVVYRQGMRRSRFGAAAA